jgi:hypothetical protein
MIYTLTRDGSRHFIPIPSYGPGCRGRRHRRLPGRCRRAARRGRGAGRSGGAVWTARDRGQRRLVQRRAGGRARGHLPPRLLPGVQLRPPELAAGPVGEPGHGLHPAGPRRPAGGPAGRADQDVPGLRAAGLGPDDLARGGQPDRLPPLHHPGHHAPGAHPHAAPVPAHERPLRPDPVHAPDEHAAVAGAGHGLVRARHLRLAGVPLPARPDRRPRPAVPAAGPVARGDPAGVTPAVPGAEHLRDQLQPPGAPAQVVRGAGPLAEPQRRPEPADLLERRPEGGRPVAAARPGGHQGAAARVVAASVSRASAGPRKCS